MNWKENGSPHVDCRGLSQAPIKNTVYSFLLVNILFLDGNVITVIDASSVMLYDKVKT